MEKKIIGSFINAAIEVLSELLKKTPSHGDVKTFEKVISSQGMAVIIGITGTLSGRMILDLSPQTAHKISEIILQERLKTEDVELIESAVNELGNMITGRAVSILNEIGHSLIITPPTMFKGDKLKIVDKNPVMLVVPIDTIIGNITLNLSVTASGNN